MTVPSLKGPEMTKDKITVAVLERSQYDRLEQAIPGGITHVTQITTDLQAGYMLGVQAVLKVLRDGFVTGRE